MRKGTFRRALAFTFALLLLLTGCAPKEKGPEEPQTFQLTEKHKLTPAAEEEERRCFDFFWENLNDNEESRGYGLIGDRYPSNGAASIASVGFGLAAIPIGVERGWITREEGQERAEKTLASMANLEHVHGFFYHFYTQRTGNPSQGSEVSNIDTAIFLCGALVSGQYFGGTVAETAKALYERAEWDWFVNSGNKRFYMSYNAKDETFAGAWDYYAEQLMMYFLGAGSPTHPITALTYGSFAKNLQSYGGYDVYHSWFGSLFTYQFSHAFIDFRHMTDPNGINWFDNSVNATLANHQYAVDYADEFATFGELSWGMTACDGPNGYNGLYGAAPSGSGSSAHENDGTVPPCGAIGSIVFAPELVLDTIDYYYTALDGALFGKYGFYDAFNLENGRVWIDKDVIGIDKGISLLMLENYRSEMIWELFMDCDFMAQAIETLQFTVTE